MRRLLGCLLGLLAVGIIIFGVGLLLILDPLELNLLDGFELPVNRDVAALPTHTPAPGGTEPEIEATLPVPVTASDDCTAIASAAGGEITADEARAERPTTLPDGSPFPNVEPRSFFQPQAAARSSFRAIEPIEAMVQFTPESAIPERDAYVATAGGSILERIDFLHTLVVAFPPDVNLAALPVSDIVVAVERNETATATQADVPDPNDPRYTEQWAFPVVGLPQAWANLPGGRNVTVAVVDSGICAAHPDLQGRLVAGFDFVDDDNDPNDTFGHGCGVAGIIAANSDNAQGIAGIAPNVNIMPLRVLDSTGQGNYADISNAIVFAVQNGADVINLSLAGPSRSSVMEAAVAFAVDNDVVVIAAAGNFGIERAFYPAAFPSVIAVGSIDPDLQRSSFSNFGADVDVMAPGRDILTTNLAGDYEFVSGTSFAAPIVAGITALTESFDVPLNTEDGIVFIYPPENIPDCS